MSTQRVQEPPPKATAPCKESLWAPLNCQSLLVLRALELSGPSVHTLAFTCVCTCNSAHVWHGEFPESFAALALGSKRLEVYAPNHHCDSIYKPIYIYMYTGLMFRCFRPSGKCSLAVLTPSLESLTPKQSLGHAEPPGIRGLQDHINIRLSHSGSKAQDKEDTRNHGL